MINSLRKNCRHLLDVAIKGGDSGMIISLGDVRVNYISIPKAGCSTIQKSIHRAYTGDREKFFSQAKFPVNLNNLNYFTFSFSRNPYNRLLSCYIDKVENNNGRMLEYFPYYKKQDKVQNFRQFIDIVCSVPDYFADRHFRSQTSLLSRFRVDYVGKLETMESDYKPIRNKFNFDEIKIKNKSKIYDLTDYYDDETSEKVYNRYQNDFENFDYKKNSFS